MILEILRKRVWTNWRITQFKKELLREKNWKRIVKMEEIIQTEMQRMTKSTSFFKKPLTSQQPRRYLCTFISLNYLLPKVLRYEQESNKQSNI